MKNGTRKAQILSLEELSIVYPHDRQALSLAANGVLGWRSAWLAYCSNSLCYRGLKVKNDAEG
jgi:hypothetical protein